MKEDLPTYKINDLDEVRNNVVKHLLIKHERDELLAAVKKLLAGVPNFTGASGLKPGEQMVVSLKIDVKALIRTQAAIAKMEGQYREWKSDEH